LRAKKILFLTGPHPSEQKSAGSEVTNAIVTTLQSQGHKIIHIESKEVESIWYNRLPWFIATTIKGLIPKIIKPNLNPHLFDVAITFEPEGLVASFNLSSKPCLIILPDMPSCRVKYTINYNKSLSNGIKIIFVEILEKIFLSYILSKNLNASYAVYGSQHARDLSQRLGRNIIDLRPQLLIRERDLKFEKPLSNKKINIVFGGSLNGTASKIAAQEIESTLAFFPDHQLILVGRSAGQFASKFVTLQGGIKVIENADNFEEILEQCDLFLMPGNYPVGVRTRIISALSAGNVVIANAAVIEGMPELNLCPAVFLYSSINEIQNIVLEITRQGLVILKKEAYCFWKDNYSIKETIKPVIRWLESC
jgi:hypothetical protein